MPTVRVLNLGNREFGGGENQSIMEVLYRYGYKIDSACGGHGQCSSCNVIVLEGMENLCPPTLEEEEAIEEFGLDERERLSCQAKLNGKGDVVISLLMNKDNYS